MSVLTGHVGRNLLRITGASIAVLAVAAGSTWYAFAAQSAPTAHAPATLQRTAGRLVADGAPGVIILSRHGNQAWPVAAGLADKATGQHIQPQDRVHIGSITKTFVAAAVLRLAAQGRLSLDDSVQKWLPGVITAHGYDPARITIRQLLHQDSGLRDYTSAPAFLTPRSLARTWQPQQLVDIALRLGPPVHGWMYSNTNYILLGMIIQKVTGQSAARVIASQILEPLGLRHTSFPLTSTQISGPHAHGYYGNLDVTTLVNPSSAWAAGAMISTVGDLAGFYQALLTGQLLPPAQRRELLTAVPVDDPGSLFAERYGLGIYSAHLSCGTAWGHDGGYPGGFKTYAFTSPDGSRQAILVYNDFKMSTPPPAGTGTPAFDRDVAKAIETAFCD